MKCEQSNCDHRHINAFDKRHKHTLTHGRTNEKKTMNYYIFIWQKYWWQPLGTLWCWKWTSKTPNSRDCTINKKTVFIWLVRAELHFYMADSSQSVVSIPVRVECLYLFRIMNTSNSSSSNSSNSSTNNNKNHMCTWLVHGSCRSTVSNQLIYYIVHIRDFHATGETMKLQSIVVRA